MSEKQKTKTAPGIKTTPSKFPSPIKKKMPFQSKKRDKKRNRDTIVISDGTTKKKARTSSFGPLVHVLPIRQDDKTLQKQSVEQTHEEWSRLGVENINLLKMMNQIFLGLVIQL